MNEIQNVIWIGCSMILIGYGNFWTGICHVILTHSMTVTMVDCIYPGNEIETFSLTTGNQTVVYLGVLAVWSRGLGMQISVVPQVVVVASLRRASS